MLLQCLSDPLPDIIRAQASSGIMYKYLYKYNAYQYFSLTYILIHLPVPISLLIALELEARGLDNDSYRRPNHIPAAPLQQNNYFWKLVHYLSKEISRLRSVTPTIT